MIESVVRNRANDMRQSLGIGIPVNVDQICSDLNIKIYEFEITAEAYLICARLRPNY